MSIILRTNKGKALSYDEMDRNQSQFFYSSSIHNDNTILRLHYTGSENLDTATENYGPDRYQEINLPSLNTDSLTATAAGTTGDVQFKGEDGQFDALSSFKFKNEQVFLGIGKGDPLDKLDIQGDSHGGGSINLRGTPINSQPGQNKHARINFYEGNDYIGQIGRVDSRNKDLYFTNNFPIGNGFGKVHIGIGAGGSKTDNADIIVAATFTRTSEGVSRVGIGTKIPNRQLSLVGTEGIGLSTTSPNTNQSIIRPINAGSEEDVLYPTTVEGRKRLVPEDSTSVGLLLSSPEDANGGNIVIAINTDNDKKEGFNIINAQNGSYTNSEVIFSAQASGKVGINTNFPSVEGLTVEGDIVSSGNIEGGGTLDISGNSILGGTLNTEGKISGNSDMYIAGNIGIGYQNVDSNIKLHIARANEVRLDLDDTRGYRQRFFTRDNDKTFGIYDVTNQYTWLRYVGDETKANNKLTLVEGGGRVGIGKSGSQIEKTLDVNGEIRGTKLIKSGGTDSQILLANGDVATLGGSSNNSVLLNTEFNVASHSSGVHGYQKFSSGFIIQFGRLSTGGSKNVTFPITFPNGCVSVTCVPDRQSNGETGAGNVTTSGFRLHIESAAGWWMAMGY